MRWLCAALLITAVTEPHASHAQLVNENLLARVPDGYKVDHQAKNDKQIVNEIARTSSWPSRVTSSR